LNGHNEKRIDQQEKRIYEEINENVIGSQLVSPALNEDSTVGSTNNERQAQMIKVNGKLYVSVQQEFLRQETKTKKHGYQDARSIKIMNDHMEFYSNH
jgi:hypothetical protein